MKLRLLLFVALALCAARPAAAAKGSGQFSVTAQRVTFYSNRYIVTADDNVSVLLSDGTRVTGNTFSMDLRLNRFVIAGNVKLFAQGKEFAGAAFSDYFDFDRQYFVPVTDEPDRWTYAGSDYAHPLLGRQMPGDTFFLPDLSGERVFLYASKALIVPHTSIRFSPASVNFGLTFVPFPDYFLNFSTNPNFAQNALSGAYVDGPLDFAGGSHALSTLHLRYDPLNKLFPAFEQHQVSDNHYLVFSVSPLTRPLKQYNVLAFDRLSPKTQIQVQLQESAFQKAFTRPLSATAFANAQFTVGLPHSYLQVTHNAYYQSLLADPAPGINGLKYYGDPSHNFVPDHPADTLLSWIGYDNRLNKSPLFLRLRSGFGQSNPPLLHRRFVGATVSAPSIRLAPNGPLHTVFLNANFDKQRMWFSPSRASLPHLIDTAQTTVSLSKSFDQKFAMLVSYTVTNTGDYYGGDQLLAYPIPATPIISLADGLPYPGYSAFRGLSTTRSFQQQFLFTPNPRISLSLALRENNDFPKPIPEPFVINAFNNVGLPPYQASLDFRIRINRLIVLNLARNYYFGFGGYERWGPLGIATLK